MVQQVNNGSFLRINLETAPEYLNVVDRNTNFNNAIFHLTDTCTYW